MEDSNNDFSKTAPCSFTEYNKHHETDHLVQWVILSSSAQEESLSASCASSSSLFSTVGSIYRSNSLPYILHQMCPHTFSMRLPVAEMEAMFIDYFQRQFGYYVKSLLTEGRKQVAMIRLILYACIYSGEKEKFVANILKLDPDVQEKLVNQIQQVESSLKQLKDWDKMIQVIKNLENENDELAVLLERSQQKIEMQLQQIKGLQHELDQTKKQLNLFVVEKRKILSNYSLSSLAEYEDLCLVLKIQNEQLAKKQQNLALTISDLQAEVASLQHIINNSDCIIAELNTQYCSLQKNYDETTKQLSCIQETFTLENESRLKGKGYRFSKTLQATADMTMPSEIKKKDSYRDNFPNDIFNQTNASQGEGRISLGRSSRNSAAWNMFNTTKNNVLLNAKVHVFEEEIDQLKLKVTELQAEISRLEDRQRYYLKKTRKIQKLSDGFQNQYQIIVGRPQFQL